MENENLRRQKAKSLRYKKPIARYLNLDEIKQTLYDIQADCEEVRWYTDSEDGSDSLVNALDGDSDEAFEFKMAFAELCAECDRMYEDLHAEWVPECFDIFFVCAGAEPVFGFDSYEGDYFGIDAYETCCAMEVAKEKLKRLTKDDLILATMQCFKVYQAFIGLQTRYDSLKAAIDILKDDNTGILLTVKEIEKQYLLAQDIQGDFAEYSKAWIEFDRYANNLPQEAWIA